MKRRSLLTAIALSAALPAVAGEHHVEGRPYYYASFAAKSVPEKPLRRLKRAEALNATLLAHYVAYYTHNGYLKRFTKYFKGKMQWESVYEYSENDRLLRGDTTSWSPSGEVVRVHYDFDRTGKIAKSTRTVTRA